MDKPDYKVLCKELDDMAMNMLRLMKDYINTKKSLEEAIKTGSLHLAKSRYIMGNRSVSVLQLPTDNSPEFVATTRVLNNVCEKSEDNLCFELNKIGLNDLPTSEVRSRKGSVKDYNEKETSNIVITDPLKWFGVLIPQNMRQAQTFFVRAIEYSVQCANIQLEMEKIRNDYSHKIKLKDDIRNEE